MTEVYSQSRRPSGFSKLVILIKKKISRMLTFAVLCTQVGRKTFPKVEILEGGKG